MIKDWWKILFGVLCGLLGAGVILLTTRQPTGEAIILRPPPSPAPVSVHVAGAVLQPGLYTLPPGSRVQDAVEAAGGFSPDANLQVINLAAYLQDGERITIPGLSDTEDQSSWPTLPAERSTNLEAIPLININTASQAELELLPGIGPITAQKIITYREANGPFTQIEDILDVPGIGDKLFSEIKELITVGT